MKSLENTRLRDGEPCSHPGCLSHISHPCEGCGRIAGKRVKPAMKTLEKMIDWCQLHVNHQKSYTKLYPDSDADKILGEKFQSTLSLLLELKQRREQDLTLEMVEVIKAQYSNSNGVCIDDCPVRGKCRDMRIASLNTKTFCTELRDWLTTQEARLKPGEG